MYKPKLIVNKEWMAIGLINLAVSRDTEVKYNILLRYLLANTKILIVEVIEVIHFLEHLHLAVKHIEHTCPITIVLPTITKQRTIENYSNINGNVNKTYTILSAISVLLIVYGIVSK